MKKIDTLVEDIYGVFDKDIHVDPEVVKDFGANIAEVISEKLKPHGNYLRLSNVGRPCDRELWYSIKHPELAEKMHGSARIKFLIGDVIEAVVLFLAKLAGHTVTRQQEKVEIDGVVGHIDGCIDGELVDVKSASPYSFDKFSAGLKPDTDSFGYLGQLRSYAAGMGHKHAYFLPVHKVLGKLHLDKHDFPDAGKETSERIAHVRTILDSDVPPPRGFSDEPEGLSGNRKLGVNCSYCAFKDTCWPGLQTYKYARGPVFLTRVVRPPRVEKA